MQSDYLESIRPVKANGGHPGGYGRQTKWPRYPLGEKNGGNTMTGREKLARAKMSLIELADFETGFAAFEGREPKMPILGCPGCNGETMEYTGVKGPPEGR
jgi:hypothetical protein